MTEAEIYEFDLNGYIIFRNLIPPDLVRRMNERLDADQAGTFPHSFSFLHLDPCFMELMAHPRTLDIMRIMIGDWLRLDHGTRKWTAPGRRRALLYKYSPGYSTWGDAAQLKQYEAMASTQLQRDLLRPPFVGNRAPLAFPEV